MEQKLAQLMHYVGQECPMDGTVMVNEITQPLIGPNDKQKDKDFRIEQNWNIV
jgi:hypothetical protein